MDIFRIVLFVSPSEKPMLILKKGVEPEASVSLLSCQYAMVKIGRLCCHHEDKAKQRDTVLKTSFQLIASKPKPFHEHTVRVQEREGSHDIQAVTAG